MTNELKIWYNNKLIVLLLEYKKFFEKIFINHLTNEKMCAIIKSQKQRATAQSRSSKVKKNFEKNFKNYLTNGKKCDIIKSQKANSQTKTTALKGRKTKRYLLWQTS